MEQKKVTFFIATSGAGVTRKFSISMGWLKALAAITMIVFLGLSTLIIDYVGLLVQTAENKKLRAENAQLLQQFQVVETKLNSMESSLERVRTFTTKLKLITNVEGEDRSLKLAMGAAPPANAAVEEYDMPMEERPPLNEVEKMDAHLNQQPQPVNDTQGELVVSGNQDYKSLAIRIEKGIRESQLREQSVLDLWESLSERQALLSSTPNIRPAKGWFTSRFGYRVSPFTGKPALHAGLDIAAAPGSPVYAPADGVVTFAGYDEGYGKLISIDHGYGITTRYGHNAQLYVQVGQRVRRWDVIASIGNTGRSTGPHLHYEVRVNGVPRDPALYILDD